MGGGVGGSQWATAVDSAIETLEGEALLLSQQQQRGLEAESMVLEPAVGYSRSSRLVSGPGTGGGIPPQAMTDTRSLFQRVYTGKSLYKITDLEPSGKH